MCLTQLEPILSATNSTVLRREGGWLWKKAWASCACGEEGTVHEGFPFSSPPEAPASALPLPAAPGWSEEAGLQDRWWWWWE